MLGEPTSMHTTLREFAQHRSDMTLGEGTLLLGFQSVYILRHQKRVVLFVSCLEDETLK